MKVFLPCAAGVEPLLAGEVGTLLPRSAPRAMRSGVGLECDELAVLALNLGSRLAQRVLVEVAQAPYRDERDLYALARGIRWAEWIGPRQTMKVDVTSRASPLKSLHFAALTVKDAVCDTMREASGERPSVDTKAADLALVLHVDAHTASLYVDTSGAPLFKRGWREDAGDAPLKETLAAAMLAAAGWHGTAQAGGALHDPCCGAGTIAIEAAQIACAIAPGLDRRFAFERLRPFATPALRKVWGEMQQAARARVRRSAVPIVASDISFRMVDFARRNAQRAGVGAAIDFHGGDALERAAPVLAPDLPGTLMLNPPYGERIEVAGKAARDRDTPEDFFPRLAAHWKRAYTAHPAGWTAYVLSPDMKLPGAMRLKASMRMPMWNGPIECRLFRFALVSGSARD